MAHDIFLSYSSKDKAVADAIVSAMENNNIRCWYAPRDIKPEGDWGEVIVNAISSSKVFLLIFSGNANRSQRVLDELNLAVTKEKTILPFRIENIVPSDAMQLHLSARHWLDAYDPSWQNHIKKLIKNISVNLNIAINYADIVVPSSIYKSAEKQKTLRRISASIVLVVALITACWCWFGFTRILR